MTNLQLCEAQPDLNGNPFLRKLRVLFRLKSSCKKDWEWKAEIAAQNILVKRNETEPNVGSQDIN